MAKRPVFIGAVGIAGELVAFAAAGVGVKHETVWPVILITSLLSILGLAAAGSTLFWKPHASEHPGNPVPATAPAALPFIVVGALLVLLALLSIFAGPVTAWLQATVDGLYAPAPYIAANRLPGGS